MSQRTTQKQLKSMVDVINTYYRISMHGVAHQLYLNRSINGYELAWVETDKHTISAHLVPWTAMTAGECWCVIKTIMDHMVYVEQSALKIERI